MERATKSARCWAANTNASSARSSGKGWEGALPGVVTPRRSVRRPPMTTRQWTSVYSMLSTRSSIRPSSSRMGRLTVASRCMPGGATETMPRSPVMSRLVRVMRSPSRISRTPGIIGPVRYLAPGTSTIMPTGIRRRSDTARTRAKAVSCVWRSPCEKFSRAMLIPLRISDSMIASDSVAGPSVQTILVLGKFLLMLVESMRHKLLRHSAGRSLDVGLDVTGAYYNEWHHIAIGKAIISVWIG